MMKKSISILLIIMMLINTSCYSTRIITKEKIKPKKKITVIMNNDEKYQIITEKVTEDTLYGRIDRHDNSATGDSLSNNNITIPVKNIELVEFEPDETSIWFLKIIATSLVLFIVYIIIDLSSKDNSHYHENY